MSKYYKMCCTSNHYDTITNYCWFLHNYIINIIISFSNTTWWCTVSSPTIISILDIISIFNNLFTWIVNIMCRLYSITISNNLFEETTSTISIRTIICRNDLVVSIMLILTRKRKEKLIKRRHDTNERENEREKRDLHMQTWLII